MSEIEIEALSASPKVRDMLSEILMEVVANGGSVSFMHPLAPEMAGAFWDDALAAAARDERIVLGAWNGDVLAGTVTLLLDCPPNQPHRAEIAKLMTRMSHRGRGVAAALMRAAEDLAVKRQRTLLVLDTATEDGASGLYEKLGFVLTGTIPDYALKPHGGLTGTKVYWKRIGGKPGEMASNARNIRTMATNIIRFFGLLLMSLLVGTMFGIWLGFNPSGLSAATYVELQQHTVRALNTVLPALGGICIVLTATLAMFTKNDMRSRYLLIGAVVCLVAAGLITRLANQPINSQVMTWSPQAPAANWGELRDSWWQWHVVRTIAGISALLLALLAALRSRNQAT